MSSQFYTTTATGYVSYTSSTNYAQSFQVSWTSPARLKKPKNIHFINRLRKEKEEVR